MMQTDTLVTPALAQAARKRPWQRWLWLWVVVVACEVLLLAFNGAADTQVWRVTRWAMGDVDKSFYSWADYQQKHAGEVDAPFYMRVPPPLKSRIYAKTSRLWSVLKSFGEPWMTVVIVCGIWVYDRRRWRAGAGMAAVAASLAGGLGALIRSADGRVRPTHTDGANTWEFLRGFQDGTDLSFPSGHATLAFAMAAVLCYLSPRGRWVFVTVAAGCAISRVMMQAHFWSDVIFGAALGWTVAWAVMALGDRMLGRWEGQAKGHAEVRRG
jgi:membrane-associated phospholipid phosphatase